METFVKITLALIISYFAQQLSIENVEMSSWFGFISVLGMVYVVVILIKSIFKK